MIRSDWVQFAKDALKRSEADKKVGLSNSDDDNEDVSLCVRVCVVRVFLDFIYLFRKMYRTKIFLLNTRDLRVRIDSIRGYCGVIQKSVLLLSMPSRAAEIRHTAM